MSEYTGSDDNMRFSNLTLEPAEVIRAAKRLLGESKEKIGQVGLAPFCASNPAPQVSVLESLILNQFFCF